MRFIRLASVSLTAAAALSIAPHLADAQVSTDKLTIHGYLTQGYAKSDGQQLIGIDKEGTSDYRRAALLTRYDFTGSDAVVLQFAHRRLGRSATTQFEDNVNIDWAFYEKRFQTGTSFRVGKAPIPFGVSNETRYVGTLLPFYRVPYNFYREGSYTSESVNGIVLRQDIADGRPWSLSTSVYGGDWTFLEYKNRAPAFSVTQARAERALGVQMFLKTPVEGLRVGVGGLRHKTFSIQRPGDPMMIDGHVSLELVRDRFSIISEARQWHFQNDTLGQSVASLTNGAFYVQASAHVTSRISINGLTDNSDLHFAPPYVPVAFHAKQSRDNGVGVDFKLSPMVVIKAENHWNKGYTAEKVYDAGFNGPPDKTVYQIVSLSASF